MTRERLPRVSVEKVAGTTADIPVHDRRIGGLVEVYPINIREGYGTEFPGGRIFTILIPPPSFFINRLSRWRSIINTPAIVIRPRRPAPAFASPPKLEKSRYPAPPPARSPRRGTPKRRVAARRGSLSGTSTITSSPTRAPGIVSTSSRIYFSPLLSVHFPQVLHPSFR